MTHSNFNFSKLDADLIYFSNQKSPSMEKLLPFLFIFLTFPLFAQEGVEITYSSSYAEQAFYRLTDNAITNIDNDGWDIALSIFGAGIFINETANFPGAENALYPAPTDNFDDVVVDPNNLTGRLFNDEKSWDYGAFNSFKDGNNANDYGWGLYDPATEVITGNRVFVIKDKNDTHQKLQIVSLDQGIYTIKYADLDGSNETTVTVDKADFPDNNFAYLKLATGQTVDNIPGDWDLLFTRYSTPVPDGGGGFIDLVTSGVLSAPGIEVAEARGVNPDDVEYADYVDSLSSVTDVIGYDWKTFENYMWTLATDLAYFVKKPNGQVWKIIFFVFGGSSTGDVIFEKTPIIANATTEQSAFGSFSVFPNPLNETSSAVFSIKQSGIVKIGLANVLGQTVWSGKYNAVSRLNAIKLPEMAIPSGTYFLSLYHGGEVVTEKVLK